jgi:hypothetical protein
MIHRITPVNDVGPQCARLPPRDITLPRAREASDCIWVARISGHIMVEQTSVAKDKAWGKARRQNMHETQFCLCASATKTENIVHMEERLINRLLLTNHERFGCTEKDATAPLGDNSCVDPTI